jgi:glycogen operon protein
MDSEDWSHGSLRPLGVFLNGEGITESGLRGENIVDDTFLLVLNPGHQDAVMTLPPDEFGKEWQPLIDTSDGNRTEGDAASVPAGHELTLTARSVVVLRRV